MKAIVSGINVDVVGLTLVGCKIAAAKAWAKAHNLSYYDVVFGVETLDMAYDDARRFTVQVLSHFEDSLK